MVICSRGYSKIQYKTNACIVLILYLTMRILPSTQSGPSGGGVKKPGKRGRKPSRIDMKAKLERSRQSARECRARKKLRYQYLEELVASRERAIFQLRNELETVSECHLNGNFDICNIDDLKQYKLK